MNRSQRTSRRQEGVVWARSLLGRPAIRMQDPVRAYEQAFGAALGPGIHATSFFKARAGFHALLGALGIGPDDEVVVPGFTCFVVPAAVVFRGAKPVYMDIDPATGNPTADQVGRCLSPRTKAIVVHHMLGNPCAELSAIVELARTKRIAVVEDCAHVLVGTRIDGVVMGAEATASFFSMQWSKPYTTGLGGMVTTRNPELADRLRQIQRALPCPSPRAVRMLLAQGVVFHGVYGTEIFAAFRDAFRWLSKRGLVVGSSTGVEWQGRKPPGYEQRLSSAQGAIGLRALQQLDVNRRQRLAGWERAREWLAHRPDWVPMPMHPQTVPHSVPVGVRHKFEMLAAADAAGLELGDWFRSPLHPLDPPYGSLGYQPGQCPQAERLCAEIINLPVHGLVPDDYWARLSRLRVHC